LYPKQIRVVGVLLMLLAGAAGFFTPYVFAIGSIAARVVILSTGLMLWFSAFETLGAISLKRKFSAARITLVFGAGILFFSFTEFFLTRISLPVAICLFVFVFLLVGMILIFRRLPVHRQK